MSLKTRAILVVVIGTLMGFGLSVGGGLLGRSPVLSEQDKGRERARLLAEVIERIHEDFVEPIDDAELLDSAVRGMVSSLDAYSEYLDADEYREIRNSSHGSYTGVGIEVSEIDNTLRVISPIVGSPAARAGIRSGDELLAVDGQAIDVKRSHDTVGLLRGRAGTKVTLSVLRDERVIDYAMHRQVIKVTSVHQQILRPSYAYLRISQFNDATAQEVNQAIGELHEEFGRRFDGVVLDLRNNPGGVLDAAVDVSDLFLNSGTIVTADGRTADATFSRLAHSGDILAGTPMVVLVNSGSASAAEIVAGALQDNNRATIVGTATFGKGLVQTVVPLSKGRAIKLTTSRYYTPSGDSIHDVGVIPDVLIEATPGYPDLSLAVTLDREVDAQLIEALQQLQARSVMHSQAK